MRTVRKRFEIRKNRVRKAIEKNSDRLRLSVNKSSRHIYVQIIDNENSRTLVAASTLEKDLKKENKSNCNIETAVKIGKLIAERATSKGITKVVFDKGGFKYHGIIKALADEARKVLQF